MVAATGNEQVGRFAGEVVLVVGGARGMGAAIAHAAAAAGAAVVVADVRVPLGEQVAAEIGSRARFVELDVLDEDAWARALDVAQQLGGPVRRLFHTAGVVRRETIADGTRAQFERMLAVNVVGPYLGIRAVRAPMIAAGGGAIVVISSVDAFAASAGYAGYCASKAGVTGLVKAAALELARDGVRVNAIAPGTIDTPMIRGRDGDRALLDALVEQVPLGRTGEADEIARAALFLASDDAAYVTGETLVVDGGVLAQVPLHPPADDRVRPPSPGR